MELSTSQIVAISLAVLTLWRSVRFLLARRSLSHIPGPRSESWWKGNFAQYFSPEGWKFHEELYRKYGGVARVDMLLGDQHLYVSDPLALQHICIKDQDIYEETERFLITYRLIFGKSLLSTIGDEHRRQRKLLNPVFSLKHLRDLLPVFNTIAHKLADVLEDELLKGDEYMDVMNWASRAALEAIGQGGLGYSFNALDERQTNGYSEALKAFQPLLFKLDFFLRFLPPAVKIGTASFRRWVVERIPSRPIAGLVSIIDTIEKHSRAILGAKRHILLNEGKLANAHIGNGKDIISVLMRANLNANGGTNLPESELLAHMSTFIAAGHDTSASAVSRILHILSYNQRAQNQLREEVSAARKDHGDLDFDTLMGLPYLDALCRETLRVYPPVPQLDRITRKDVVLPLLWPIKSADGMTDIKEIHVKKDTTVYISIVGANRHKAIWGEDADEWKPERWLKPLPKSVNDACLPGVYSQMMTFLGGPRACIGFKFSEIEIKVILSVLLERFVFEPGPDVYWCLGALNHPVVKTPEGEKTEVPLKVTLVRK